MQSPLEQRELDAIRYNTDGRCFRLDIQGEVLSLDAVSSFNFLADLKELIPPLLAVNFLFYFISPSLPPEVWIRVVLLCSLTQTFIFLWSRLFKEDSRSFGAKWIFDRATDSLKIDKNAATRLSDVVGVTAWPKGKRRFLLALNSKDGKRIYIGSWCFSTKEFSWREDAQIVANFLNVPLHIPEV